MKAITNATILCPVSGLIENGTVLFDGGKITSVGKNVTIPEGTEIIDGQGKYVLPGFIDAHTHQGLFDGSVGWAGMDGNEMTEAVTPEIRGLDSFNPFEPTLEEVLMGGVTSINTGPGSGNVISGQAFVIKPVGKIVEEMIVMAPSGLKVALGENPKRVHGAENKRMPMTRMGVAGLLRKTFSDAINYIAEWDHYNKRLKALEEEGKPPPPVIPKKNLRMEVIKQVLSKEIPVHAHCHRADDIATIIRLAEEFDVRLVLIHATEGHKIADHIAKKGVPAVIGPSMLSVSKPETRERGFKTAVELVKAGVKVALQTDYLTPMNYFPLLPMNVIKEGMSRDDALKCVTINPAEILGLENRIGSLEAGKDADIVVWSGHPFEFYSKVEKVFINGEDVYPKKG